MRFTQHVLLLVAALPLAFAQYTPPPGDLCSAGTYRCDDNKLQSCNDAGAWETTKECTKTAYCFAQDTINGSGGCYPLGSADDEQCSTANEHRCDNNSLQKCYDHGYWKTTKQCTKTAYCFAQDSVKGGGGCHSLVSDDTQCSVVDLHRCDGGTNATILQKCNDHGYWQKVKECSKTAYCFAQDTINGGGDCHPLIGSNTKQCSMTNEHRCDTNTNANTTTLQICGGQGYWQDVKACSKFERCQVNDSIANGADCIPLIDNGSPQCGTSTHSCHENLIKKTIYVEACTQVNTERCAHRPDRIQKCQAQYTGGLGWVDTTYCKPLSSCVESTAGGNKSTRCQPRSSSISVSAPEATYPPEPCKIGDFNCSSDFYSLLLCNDSRKWQTSKKCYTPGDCKIDGPGQAHCDQGGTEPPKLSQLEAAYPPEPCRTGDYTCSSDFYILLVCNPAQKWQTSKKCTTPGDCKIDGPGKAHCERGGIDPPRLSRRNATCKVGDYACATDLTTLAICNANQQWVANKKCANPGDCRSDGPGKAHCAAAPATVVLSDLPWCKVGEFTCASDGRRLLICMMQNVWKPVGSECACKIDGPGKAHCENKAVVARATTSVDDAGECDGRCEMIGYLYCVGVGVATVFEGG
jgi:hypothetical protein